MSLHLTDTRKALSVERKKETLKKGLAQLPQWIFTNEVGNMMDTENFRHRVWAKLHTKAGMRRIRIHDLRHTFVSLLIQQGESLAYVKEQMGHHSIVTVDVYGHLVPGGNKKDAVDRLDDPVSENTLPTRNSSEVDKRDSVLQDGKKDKKAE